jgi:hypothetical protein
MEGIEFPLESINQDIDYIDGSIGDIYNDSSSQEEFDKAIGADCENIDLD